VPITQAGHFAGIAIMITGIAILGVLSGSLRRSSSRAVHGHRFARACAAGFHGRAVDPRRTARPCRPGADPAAARRRTCPDHALVPALQ
jgi:hypothetical protein